MTTDAFNAQSAIHTSVWKLADEFGANAVAAGSKYGTASIVLEGSVENVQQGDLFSNGPEVNFNTKPFVIALVADRQAASALRPDDRVSLSCVGAKSQSTVVVVSDCEIDEAKAPHPNPTDVDTTGDE